MEQMSELTNRQSTRQLDRKKTKFQGEEKV